MKRILTAILFASSLFLSTSAQILPGILAGGGGVARVQLTTLLGDGSTRANYQGGVGYTGSSTASSWANQIGVEPSLDQATGANQPTISSNSLICNGSNSWMQTGSFTTVASPYTLYMVSNTVTWVASKAIIDGNGALQIFTNTTTPNLSMFAGSTGPTVTTATVGTAHVLTAVFNGVSSTFSVDGGTNSTGNPGTASTLSITICGTHGGASLANVQIYEVILRAGADSSSMQAQVQSLLKQIYATP